MAAGTIRAALDAGLAVAAEPGASVHRCPAALLDADPVRAVQCSNPLRAAIFLARVTKAVGAPEGAGAGAGAGVGAGCGRVVVRPRAVVGCVRGGCAAEGVGSCASR